MILLPDIRLGRDILSIQEPFTLNNYLVTDINVITEMTMSYQTTLSGRIQIRNENNYNVELRLEDFNYYFDREMRCFLDRYGSYAHVEGRRDIHNWSNYNFNKYINEIKLQCNKIHDSIYYSYNHDNSHYLNALKSDLRRQGRDFTSNRIIPNYSDLFYTFGTSVASATTAFNRLATGISGINNGSNSGLNSTRKYIHEYDYKPTYIHNYMPDEDKDATLILGVEIEVAGNEKEPNREDVVKKCIQIMNGSEDDTENLIYSTSDSTVQIELDTMPCSLEFHKNKMNYKELFKYLDELGYKGHDCDKAGLHIHADRKYLGKSELVQQLTISKILYIIEKFNDEICVIARRNNSYSQFAGNKKDETSVVELYSKYKEKGKHVALNLKHKESIEFRCFKSTLKYETFMLTLEFVKNIIDFAKSINIEEIELIKWSDLMNTFSDELKEYYNDRLEKENRKKEENTVTLSASGLSLGNTRISSRILTIDDVFCPTISTSEIESEPINANWVRSCLNNSASFEGTLSVDWTLRDMAEIYLNSTNTNSIKSEEEKLKDKIKSLKKKIKNSNNFMEKKNLEKELNETQKELKKEKKKNRLNNNTER